MEEIVYRNSKKRLVLLLAGCGMFVAMGIWIVTCDHSSKAQTVGWANIAFFGLGVLVAAKQLTDNRPRITINDTGITDRTLNLGTIEWADITGVSVYRIHGTHFIGLELENEQKYLTRVPGWQQKMAAGNEALGFNRINLNLSSMSVNPDQLCDLILSKATNARRSDFNPNK